MTFQLLEILGHLSLVTRIKIIDFSKIGSHDIFDKIHQYEPNLQKKKEEGR